MEKIIQVKNLSFKYSEQIVFDNISFDISKGDFLAFVGPNGSGKSSLMRLLIGDLTPDKGEIRLLGQKVAKFRKWSKIGYMSQQIREFNHSFPATVKEVIAANLYHHMGIIKVLNKDMDIKIDRALKLVDMYSYKNRQIGNLSGGQQQRVFIARTLVTNPELIFLDEPMVGIDAKSQDEFIRLINSLNRDFDITVVMVSHDIHVISSQANKVACFANKKIYFHLAEDFDYNHYQNESNNSRILPQHTHINSERSDSHA